MHFKPGLPSSLLGLLTVVVLEVSSCGGSSPAAQQPAPPGSASAPPITAYSAEPEFPRGTALVRAGTPGIVCSEWIVLATDRLDYSPDEVRLMHSFRLDDVLKGAPLPSLLLRKVAGVLTDKNIDAWVGGADCHVNLQLTNTSSGVVQVPQIGWRLTSPPAPNREQYRLPDFCQIDASLCGFGRGGGPRACDLYTVQVDLTGARGGVDLLGTPAARDRNDRPCPPITLNPGQSTEVFLSAVASEASIYSAEPVLVASASGQSTTLPLTTMAGTMPFADPGQFSCYVLRGSSFAAMWRGKDAVDRSAHHVDSTWCV